MNLFKTLSDTASEALDAVENIVSDTSDQIDEAIEILDSVLAQES